MNKKLSTQARLDNQENRDMIEDDGHIQTYYYDRRVAFVNKFYAWYGSVGAIYLVIEEKEQKKKHKTTKKNKKYV